MTAPNATDSSQWRDDWRARRPTPSERLHEVTMAALRRQPVQSEHTVDLTLNAKGDVQIAVAARGADLEAVAAEAVAVFDDLCKRYPRPMPPAPAATEAATRALRSAGGRKGGAK